MEGLLKELLRNTSLSPLWTAQLSAIITNNPTGASD